MKFKFINAVFIGMVLATSSITANAGIIASTDFDDCTVSGCEAADLNWILDGLSNPGDLSVVGGYNLFTTLSADGKFAVDQNLINDGSWSVDIALNVLANNDIALSEITLDAFTTNNRGGFQTAPRDFDINAEFFDFNGVSLFSVSLENVGGNHSGNANEVSLILDGLGLFANNDYNLRLTVSADSGSGVNGAIDNLKIYGETTQVPEPSTFAIFALGMIGLASRRFKNNA